MSETRYTEQAGQATLFVSGDRGALVSECGRYRYRLWRLWNANAPIMTWVLLNPSTADANVDDPTLRKCIGFAKAQRYGGVILVNLFAWRATDPSELSAVVDPIGPENDDHILWGARAPMLGSVVAGWGAEKFAETRGRYVRTLISPHRMLNCFGKSKGGHPRHPLYLPYAASMVEL